MTRFTDDCRTVTEIGLYECDIENVSRGACDFSCDFYEVGSLPYDEEIGAYVVNDVEYLIEQAEDWLNQRGDYRDDIVPEGKEREIRILNNLYSYEADII